MANIRWHLATCYQKLSTKFLIKYHHKIDWYYVMVYQPIDVNFIRELEANNLEHLIEWNHISKNKNISRLFIIEYFSKFILDLKNQELHLWNIYYCRNNNDIQNLLKDMHFDTNVDIEEVD